MKTTKLRLLRGNDFNVYSGAVPAPGHPRGFNPTAPADAAQAELWGPWIGTVFVDFGEPGKGNVQECDILVGGMHEDLARTMWLVSIAVPDELQCDLHMTELVLEVPNR